MNPKTVTRAGVSTSLWIGLGVVLLALGATLFIYGWQAHQFSSRVEFLTSTRALEQAAWQMQQSNSDIARYLSDYIRDRDRDHIRDLSDAEFAFDRAALAFSRLAGSEAAAGQSGEINSLSAGLRKSADDIVSLVERQQVLLTSVRDTSREVGDLMQGMIEATIDSDAPNRDEKLGTVLNIARSLDELTTGIGAWISTSDTAGVQQVVNAGEELKHLISSFQSHDLSPLESTWTAHMQGRVEKLLMESAELFAVRDSLTDTMVQFRDYSAGMKRLLIEQVQPLVDTEIVAANRALTGSADLADSWVPILGIAGIAAGLTAAVIISRKITRPIKQLLNGADLVASGRIEHRFNTDAKGEFGQFALGLNKMLDNLKRSRDALGESEELAWALLDATDDAVVLTDLRGTVLASNEIAARRLDRSLEQMIDESLYDLLPPEAAASLKARVAEISRTGKPVHYEDEREGKIIEHDVYPVSEHKGEISRFAFFSRDVTMRKWVEDVTEQLARRNSLILESAGEGIFGLDMEGRTTFVNPAAALMHGYKPEELVGKKHHDLVHHSTASGRLYPPEECPVHTTLKDGTIRSNVDNEVFWRKDGTSFQVEYTSTPIRENKRIVGAVITFRDISDRKRVEKALRDSEEKYRSVFESAASLIVWLDEEGNVMDSNPRIEQFLGYTPAEIIGHKFLELVHQQDQPRVAEALGVTAREGFEYDNHFRMVLKSGKSIAVSMNTAVAYDTVAGQDRTICMISAASQPIRKLSV